jgi:hypothetical protein
MFPKIKTPRKGSFDLRPTDEEGSTERSSANVVINSMRINGLFVIIKV